MKVGHRAHCADIISFLYSAPRVWFATSMQKSNYCHRFCANSSTISANSSPALGVFHSGTRVDVKNFNSILSLDVKVCSKLVS